MTYFISIDEIKQNNVINANVDSEYIEPALREAQDVYLREIIGDALYNAIESRINDNNLTDQYSVLVNQYIKPYLENRMLASLVVPITMKIRNAGVIQQFDQGFNSSNVKDVAYLADYYNNRVEFYENRMTEYLKKNTADFPEYGYSSENITNPSQTHTAGTIYLGGGRKRSCGLKTGSGGGSTDKVEWNDIQNKPDFATVATSGSYNDLQNKPQINNATLTIKQGGTTKGTFTANAGTDVEIDLEAGGSGSTDWNDIQNKPDFAPVAESGSYTDLSNRPDLNDYVDVATYNQKMNDVDNALENRVTYGVYTPKIEAIDNALNDKVDTVALCTINNERLDTRGNFELVRTDSIATLTIKQGGTTKGTFTPNSGTDVEINLETGGSGTTDWNDIQNKPNFATVATSGSYTDLNDKPTIPTKTSELTNDSGYSTFSGSYNDLRDIPNYFSYIQENGSHNGVILNGETQFGEIKADIAAGIQCNFKVDKAQSTKLYTDYIITGENTSGRNELVVSGDDGSNVYGKIAKDGIYEGNSKLSDKYLQIANLPTNVSAFTNDAGYTTFDGDYNSLTNKPTIPAPQVQSDWNQTNTSEVDYIKNKPTIPVVPTNVSAFSNDAGYLTQHQSLAGYATETYVNNAIQQVEDEIPTVPTNVSAFNNDAGYLTQHQSLAGYATENWVQQQGYSTFSGSYNDLSDKPTIPAKTSELTNDSGFTTFDGDYNSLTNKPTIPTAQVQSDWNANSGMGQILNKPSMTAETWTFTVDDGQGGTTTVTKTVWLQ